MRKRYWKQLLFMLLIAFLSAVMLRPAETKAGIFDTSSEVTYKEYWVPHTQFTGGCGDQEKPFGSWYLEPYGCDKTVSLQIPDNFTNALKAEIYLDLWRNQDGQLSRFSINGGQSYAPNVGSNWSRTPYIGEISLADLLTGTNSITFWGGGYHVHDIAIRIYYNDANPLIAGAGSDVTPPDGALLTIKGDGAALEAGAGGNLQVNNNQLTLTADVSNGAKYVEFHAYYFGMDEDTDGQFRDWHNRGRNNWYPGGTGEKPTGGTIDHPGTVATPNDGQYTVNWDVSTVPDQDGVRFKIRVVDAAGNVREAAGGVSNQFSLTRTQALIAYWNPNFNDYGLWMEGTRPPAISTKFWMPTDYNYENFESGIILHSFWHGAIMKFNNEAKQFWPNFIDSDMWQMSIVNINPIFLWKGVNKVEYIYDNPTSTRPGAFVEKPGPMFVLKQVPWTVDRTAPSIYNPDPAMAAFDVKAGTAIRYQLVDEHSGLDYSTLLMKVQGEVVTPAVSGAKHSAQVGYRPSESFDSGEEVEVYVEICDLVGNCMSQTYSFDVEGELLPSGITSDDFNSCSLNETVWEFRDPVGNADYEVNGTTIAITVPAGSNHDLWENANDAPRIMQPANDTDFRISAKFDTPVSEKFQFQGILVGEDENDLIRFSMRHDGVQAYYEIYSFENGVPINRLDLPVGQAAAFQVPTVLSVDRVGNQWRLLTLDESEQWVELKRFDYSLDVSEVGVFVGNKGVPPSTAPAFTSIIDFFFDDNDPIDPQDQAPLTLPVEVVGEGVVQKSPLCGNPVTLTADSAAGYFFQGWSSTTGTLSGRANPLVNYAFTAGEVVTATFHVNELYLNVEVDNDGAGEGGSVTISPDKTVYYFEDQVTLIPNIPTGWNFLGWSGDVPAGDENDNPLLLVMDRNVEITASFAAKPVTLEVDVVGTGTVDISPDEGGDYQYGDTVTLTPVPGDGWSFDHWEGDYTGTERPLVLKLEADTELTAVFEERPPWVFLPVVMN